MPRGIKLPGRRGRRDSEPNEARLGDDHSETYTARLDRILDEPAGPAATEPETKRPKPAPDAAG